METPLLFFVEVGKYLIVGYVIALLGRAVAARIAGPQAGLVLGTALISISIPLPRHSKGDPESENDAETENTETLGNTGNSSVSLPETPEIVSLSSKGDTWPALRMTPEERDELLRTRHEAIALLDRCVKFYRETGKADDGTIPRYNDINMQAELRGAIVNTLVYSGFVSVIKNKRTFVVPEIGTCAGLMYLLINNKRRVYPVGYAERNKELLDSAVSALPEVKR
jgi:hypothetical protein